MSSLAAEENYKTLVNCVACDSTDLKPVLDLGHQQLANEYASTNNRPETFPLALNLCGHCFHSQLNIAVNPHRLFTDYSYVSGTSETLYRYFEFLRDQIVLEHGANGKLLDIGSNDGTFLSTFNKTGWSTLGIDPAINLIIESAKRGVRTIPAFFTEELSDLLSPDFDVIVAMNVFAHTANPLDVLMGIKKTLGKNGIAYIQTSQANMFENSEFDTIYHEHISFFSVRSMKALLKRAGLVLVGVDFASVHGKSYVWKIKHLEETVLHTIEREEKEELLGMYGPDLYKKFSVDAQNIAKKVAAKVDEYRGNGYLIASYGAAAKGNTFLNFANITLDFIFDDTPHKIGKWAPAGGCMVSNPTEIALLNKKTLFLIPAWNFKSEILGKISQLINREDCISIVYYPMLLEEEITPK
jgi:2-polyprenyl-3-methyl-5-hydroxy-6-metoxy-1,4-benzoquinol methylase